MAQASFDGPALAMLDIADMPRGLMALDALSKEASVSLLSAGTIQSGRYLILFGGEVEATERAFARGTAAAQTALCDTMLLPWADERIAVAIIENRRRWPSPGDTLGVVQNQTSPTLVAAVDAALKGALVELVELRVGDGLGGKAIASFWGKDHDVEAALALADDRARAQGAETWSQTVIRNADQNVHDSLARGSRFFSEWRG